MIEAAILDMDGLIIDSEPFWQDAEIEVFGALGVPLTREMCLQATGIGVGQVIPYWHARHPWKGMSFAEVEAKILHGVEQRVRERGTACNGVEALIDFLRARSIRLALASSSNMHLIRTVLEKLSLTGVFEVVHSGEKEELGKPHPAVFLSTARQLNVEPTRCLVFEDSFAGLVAATAARMKTVAVPSAAQIDDPRFSIAGLKLRSLVEFGEAQWDRINRL